jgi:hypothetical protein
MMVPRCKMTFGEEIGVKKKLVSVHLFAEEIGVSSSFRPSKKKLVSVHLFAEEIGVSSSFRPSRRWTDTNYFRRNAHGDPPHPTIPRSSKEDVVCLLPAGAIHSMVCSHRRR